MDHGRLQAPIHLELKRKDHSLMDEIISRLEKLEGRVNHLRGRL